MVVMQRKKISTYFCRDTAQLLCKHCADKGRTSIRRVLWTLRLLKAMFPTFAEITLTVHVAMSAQSGITVQMSTHFDADKIESRSNIVSRNKCLQGHRHITCINITYNNEYYTDILCLGCLHLVPQLHNWHVKYTVAQKLTTLLVVLNRTKPTATTQSAFNHTPHVIHTIIINVVGAVIRSKRKMRSHTHIHCA